MRRQRGFTLVEIMIAVLIAAILAVMAFESMQHSLKSRDRIRTHQARLQALQFTMRSLVQDLSQVYPRAVREPLGPGYQAAVVGGIELAFTRGGWSNPLGLERSTLQRVRYVLREGKLYREYWLVLDAQLYPAPVSRELLDNVLNFRMRFLNDGKNWQDSWPSPSQQGGALAMRELLARPVAVEITLELKDFGVLTRLIEVAG